MGCNVSNRENFDFSELDNKTSFDSTIAPGVVQNTDFSNYNPFGSIASDRRSFTKEIEIQSVDCNLSCSQYSDKNSVIDFGKSSNYFKPLNKEPLSEALNAVEKSEVTIAEKTPEITEKKVEMIPPQSMPTESVYKTPNYKGKKRSNINYVTKHSTKDIKGHEELMKKKYGVKLSVRKDVVNKTLFRALKRFYTDKFMEIYSLSKKESSESYMNKVKTF